MQQRLVACYAASGWDREGPTLLRLLSFLLVLITPLVILACSGPDDPEQDGRLMVVTTVSPITSLVENIGGDRIRLEGIVPEGVNSHTFEPAPSVARLVARADLIVLNGLFLEEPSLEMARANKKRDAVILLLADSTISRDQWAFDFSFPQSAGRPNPHLWPDPNLALHYAELLHEKLVELDPDNAAYYDANLDAFRERINQYDTAFRVAIASIPTQNRRLLTYHDSWAYFARRYGMEVVGAVQPSDFTEPSARTVARLIDQVKELGLPAIFGSEVFSSKILEQIARESGARFIDSLADDDLPGSPGDPRHSYLGLMLQNVEIMVEALGGDLAALSDLDPSLVFQGESGAVYP